MYLQTELYSEQCLYLFLFQIMHNILFIKKLLYICTRKQKIKSCVLHNQNMIFYVQGTMFLHTGRVVRNAVLDSKESVTIPPGLYKDPGFFMP